MKSYTKLSILTILLLGSVTLTAQTFKAEYIYDANGNRVTAKVVYLSRSSSSPSPKVEEELQVDPSTTLTISIFPNPTQGELRVELTGATPEQLGTPSNSIKIWDVQGRLLLNTRSLGASNVVDLSSYSSGIYTMQLFFGGKVKDFKIVKN